MEEFRLTRTLSRQWLPILLITALVTGVAWAVSLSRPKSVYGSLSITVRTTRNYPTNGQLILQPASTADNQLMVATTQSWLSNPGYVREIISQAGVSLPDTSLKRFAGYFQIVAPVANSASYQVETSGESSDELGRVFSATRQVMNKVADQYNSSDQADLKLSLLYSDPVLTTVSSTVPLTPIAGLVAGLAFALATAAILDRKKE